MTDPKRTLKQKVYQEIKEYLAISFYLWVVFALLLLYQSTILAQHRIDFAYHGFALINALALGKVILVAQDLHLGNQFKEAPLIYPTLFKAAVFAITLGIFKILEET